MLSEKLVTVLVVMLVVFICMWIAIEFDDWWSAKQSQKKEKKGNDYYKIMARLHEKNKRG